ncbi:MAG: hypothetical protein ABIR17_11025 [Pseudolysinimonas sp.]|uniref:variant leucine-rich repeat-containing protein n=1 Tax=Pseudolysinimonas sp. TaxID=2680009 RepID=UPI0032651C70
MAIDRDISLTELGDPATEPARLAEIAHAFPDLAPQITAHPNVYPDLVAWLAAHRAVPLSPAAAVTLTRRTPLLATAEAEHIPPPPAPARKTLVGIGIGAFTLILVIVVAVVAFAYRGSAPTFFADGGSDGGDSDGGAAATVACPSGSTQVMWSNWDGGATLVCKFESGGYVMIVANGGSLAQSEDVTSTPTGYSSSLAEVGFGGWVVWLPNGSDGIAATSWGNSDFGDASGEPPAASGIAACPSGSYPLSLSQWSGGWLLICGISSEQPTSFSYLDGSRSGSGGNLNLSGGRYCGTDENESEVCVSAAPALVQFTPADDGYSTRFSVTSNYFAGSGVGGQGKGTGAYGVAAPGSTAEDQVGYLVAILEKSAEARSAVNSVLAPLNACSVSSDDVAALQTLTQARTDLLDALHSTPVDQVPGGDNLLAQLTSAIQLSQQADLGYVDAAQIMSSGDCSNGKGTYRNALNIADQAEAAKQAFVDSWNGSIAATFGVGTYTAKDI